MSAAKHTLPGHSANQTIAAAKRADAAVRKELHLTSAQLQYLKTAEDGTVKDWAAPSWGTLQSLLNRGLLEYRVTGGHVSANSTRFFHLTPKGYHALDIAERLARAAIARATGAAQ